MAKRRRVRSEQDSVWKEVLSYYFEEFIAFFFPEVHQDIDWNKKYEFLDKELEKISPKNLSGKRYVDKLVKVFLHGGEETWVLIHIEVQGSQIANFEERMFQYFTRIKERYHQEPFSIAILTDNNPDYKPDTYQSNLWRRELSFRYPIIKILDYNSRWEELESSPNPFAIIVMAQSKFLELRKQSDKLDWKLRLVRMLYRRGYKRDDIIQLFRFIDWMIALPEKLEDTFWEEIAKEEEQSMPYVTSVERRALKRGKEEGRQEGRQEGMFLITLRLIKRKFGEIEPALEEQIKTLTSEQLEAFGDALLDFSSQNEVKEWLDSKTR